MKEEEIEIRKFGLHFEDLSEIAQHYFCLHFKTTKEEESLRSSSLAVVERRMEVKEKEES